MLQGLPMHDSVINATISCPCGSQTIMENCCLKTCCEYCLTSPSYQNLRNKGFYLEKSLIRQQRLCHITMCHVLEKFTPKTVIISGNGSVEARFPNTKKDVWSVVQEAVDSYKQTPLGCGVGVPARAFECLQHISSRENLATYYNNEKPGSIIDPESLNFRLLLAKKISETNITLRELKCFCCPECKNKLHPKHLASCGIITLNWDTAVEYLPHTLHLHGKINHPQGMIFPGQTILNTASKGGNPTQAFGSIRTANNWLSNCKNLIVWGCNFNDYDSLLADIVMLNTLENQQHLNIFVSNPHKKELEKKISIRFPIANFINCLKDIKHLI